MYLLMIYQQDSSFCLWVFPSRLFPLSMEETERKTRMFHRFTRKGFLVIPLIVLLMATMYSMFFTRVSAATTLGAAATQSGRFFGAAMESGRLGNNPYTTVLDREFNSTTPGNEMKWETTEPSRNTFNFGPGDTIVNHALAHNMKVRGHTLVWHSQLAPWVNSVSSGTDLLAAMRNHVTQEVTHFRGNIWYWDVVNEAFNEDGSRRSSPFQNLIGNSFIEQAFISARAADPAAKLCYNDFNIEGQNAKSNAVFAMVQDFKSRNIPIDCVGFQAHLIMGQVPSTLQANLQRFANLGVDVQITELDIRMPINAQNFTQQATDYANVIKACLAVTRCNDITVWGVGDADSWIPGVFPDQGFALLFDNNYNPKPAYNSVLAALNAVVGTPTPTATPTRTPTATATATATQQPTSTPTTGPGSNCSVHYAVTNQWQTGFGAMITITNTGTTAINGWSLTFTFANGQTITQLWNGAFTQSGGNVTITNLSYNGSIPAGTALGNAPGFNAAWSGTNTAPTSFKLNGVTCSVV